MAVESWDQDIPGQVPRTNCQDIQDCSRIKWFQGPGACKIVERIYREVIDDASQDKGKACVIFPALVPGGL